jgi:uncharacterized protein YndB with AHSA1/START domain
MTTTATGNRSILTTPTDRSIRVERIFDAPRERVWRAFTDPTQLPLWWGRGNKVLIEKFELKPGGHWRFVEESEGQMHGFEGRYGEVTPPEKLVYTFEWDGLPAHTIFETTTFEDLGDGRTRVVNTSLFFTTDERNGMMAAGMEGGLNQSYAALDRLLAS